MSEPTRIGKIVLSAATAIMVYWLLLLVFLIASLA
jgi:hypothetical protein